MTMTKGQIEAEMTRSIIQFEKEYLGRGPQDARTYLIEDMVFIRLKGLMTPAERTLAETKDGRELIKNTRAHLFELSRPLLEDMVKRVTGSNMVSLHSDMSSRTGERIIVLTVDENLEKKYR